MREYSNPAGLSLCHVFDPASAPTIDKPEIAAMAVLDFIPNFDREVLVVGTLTSMNQVISLKAVHIGNISSAPCDIPCILRDVLLDGATRFLIAHNHPSGDPAPSSEDIEVTEKLLQATKIMDMHCLDHIIVADRHGRQFRSLRREVKGFSS